MQCGWNSYGGRSVGVAAAQERHDERCQRGSRGMMHCVERESGYDEFATVGGVEVGVEAEVEIVVEIEVGISE